MPSSSDSELLSSIKITNASTQMRLVDRLVKKVIYMHWTPLVVVEECSILTWCIPLGVKSAI